MEVDIYGPVDILCYVNDEDRLWHGVIANQNYAKSSSEDNFDDCNRSGTFMESIRGTSLNQFLLIYFNVCGQEYRLQHAQDPNMAQVQKIGDPLEFPGGDRSLWASSLKDVYTFCSTMCPIHYILARIEKIVSVYVSGKNNSTVFDDTVSGAIEFLLSWTNGNNCQYMDLKQLLDIRRFTTCVLKLLRDIGETQLTPRLMVLGEQVDTECSKATLRGPDNRYVPILPVNNSLKIIQEDKKKKLWKREQEQIARQRETDELAAKQAAQTQAETVTTPQEGYMKGQRVLYMNTEECTIVGRHMDDYPDIYYTIQFPDGREKQTEVIKLTPVSNTNPNGDSSNNESKNNPTSDSNTANANDDPNYVPAIFGLKLDDDSDEDSASDFSKSSIDEMKKEADETAARYKRDLEEEENRKKQQEEATALMEEKTDPALKVSLEADSICGNGIPYALSYIYPSFDFYANPKELYHELFAMNVYEIARQWTLVDQKLFASIPLMRFMNKNWSKPRYMNESAPIRKFIDRFNATSLWTTMTLLKANSATTTQITIADGRDQNIPEHVLNGTSIQNTDLPGTPGDRARMYTWLVELAACFDGLNNFSGMIAILSGLQQPSVTRLGPTLQLVPEKTKNTFQRLQILSAVNKNYSAYRSELGRRVESLCDDETDSVEYDQKKSQVDFAETTAGDIFSSWGIEFSIKHPLARGTTGVVPHLGPHLHEIVAIDEGNSDRIPDFPNLINLKKKMMLARTVSTLKELQGLTYYSSMSKVEEVGRSLGSGKKFIRPIRRIASMIGLHLQSWVDLNSSSNIKKNEIDKQLHALSHSLEASNDVEYNQSYRNVSKNNDIGNESLYDSPTGFLSQQQLDPLQFQQQQQQLEQYNNQNKQYSVTKNPADGIRRYNDRGEETDSLASSDYNGSPNRKAGGGIFSKLFKGIRSK